MDRKSVIKQIKADLRRRSGKQWSVTGGRGTAYGWLKIDAPPQRRTAIFRLKEGMNDLPGNYEEIDTGVANSGHMTPADREELKALLRLDSIHFQGVDIPASNAHYEEYIDRAAGRIPSKIAEAYWD